MTSSASMLFLPLYLYLDRPGVSALVVQVYAPDPN
jgi:hypothetical protein